MSITKQPTDFGLRQNNPIFYNPDLEEYGVNIDGSVYGRFTEPELIVDEADLGIDGVHDGGDSATDFTDTGETFTPASVAEGFRIYNVTDASDALINADSLYGHAGDGGAGNPTADDIAHADLANGTDNDWDDTEVASIPECKRFIVSSAGYNHLILDWFMDSKDQYNSCYFKIYGTLDENADNSDDIYWKDLTESLLSGHADFNGTYKAIAADGILNAARTVSQGLIVIDNPTPMFKYMIKIVAENSNGTQDNEFKMIIVKSSM